MKIQENKKNLQVYTDVEIIEFILDGGTGMFELLIRRYNPILYKIGRGYGFIHEDTEDLMQDAFVNCFKALTKFENRAAFKSWLIRIMLNLCYQKTHGKVDLNKQLISLSINEESMMVTSEISNPIKSIMNKELKIVIENALNHLPEDYRRIFTLRELAGLSVIETGDLLKITSSNVKVRLNRAKMMLRKEIEKIYSTEDIYEFHLIYCDKIVNRVMNKITNEQN